MRPPRLICIVEGHGEVEALPLLVRRIGAELEPPCVPDLPPPIRIPRDKLIRKDLERAVELAARKVQQGGGILILLDADDDCPAEIGPSLLGRARAARGDLPISVVIAKREFEAWFLAAARSLRGVRRLSNDLEPPDDPESVRGAKEWLSKRRSSGSYRPVVDQSALTASLDLVETTRRSPSFEKCFREIERLLGLLRTETDEA